MNTPSLDSVAKMIDHALLAPSLSLGELDAGCRLARSYGVASVCCLPYYVKRASALLRDSDVKPSTVIGFPHGAQATRIKVLESEQAILDGAEELDLVVNVSQVKSGAFDYVGEEIASVLAACRAGGAKLKVIFENCYLDDSEKIRLCQICGELGVDWVKTSTGFGPTGATLEDLALMRKHTPESVQLKASGGIRDIDFVLAARELGATRCGLSKTADILESYRRRIASVRDA